MVLITLFALLALGLGVATAWAAGPVVDAGPNAAITEGDTFSSSGSFTDPDATTSTVWAATVNYGDGGGDEPLSLNPDKTFDLSHTYPNAGTYTVTVEVSNGTDTGSDTATVTVENDAPVVEAGPNATILEGDTFSSSGSFTDPGASTSWTATVDYGDGGGPVALSLNPDKTFDLSHTYTTAGEYTVTVVVTDDSSDSGSDTASVTVTVPVPPVVETSGGATVFLPGGYMETGFFTDSDEKGPWTGTVDYGDGDGVETLTLNPDKTFDLSHTYSAAGDYTVFVTVADALGVYGTSTVAVHVDIHDPPVVDAGPDATVDEGSVFSSSGSFTDDLFDTSWTATVDYGDGSGTVALPLNEDKTFSLSHVYADNGAYTVIVTVTDDDGDSGMDTILVTVNNVTPVVSVGADASIAEGGTFVRVGTFTDPGADTWSATVDYGDGGGPVALALNIDGSFTLNHTYAQDGSYTVTVVVTDGDPGSGSLVVTVTNVAPVVSPGGDIAIFEGSAVTRQGSFTDPGDDPWTGTVDYGEGAGPQPLTINLSTQIFDLSNVYEAAGTYTVTVTVSDDDTSGSATFTVLVVEPAAGPDPTLNPPAASTGSNSQNVTFSTGGQDIWGPVTGGSGTVEWTLFHFPWNTGTKKAGDIIWNALGTSFDFGAEISASTSGHVGMTAAAKDLSGAVDVTFPVNVTLGYPNVDSFLAGATVNITSIWNLRPGATIENSKTRSDLTLNGQFDFNAAAGATLCVFDCASWNFFPTIDWGPFDFEIFSFEAFDETPSLPSGLLGVGGTLKSLSVVPSSVSANPNGTITASGNNKFSNIEFDIDRIARFFGAPPLGAGVTVNGSAQISFDLFDLKAFVEFWAKQSLEFKGTPWVRLDFSRPVAQIVGAYDSVDPGKSWVVYKAGTNISVVYPPGETDPITVTPTVFLTNTFKNYTDLETLSYMQMLAGKFNFALPGFEIIPATYFPHWHHEEWHCHTRDALGTCWWWHAHGFWHQHQLTPPLSTPSINFQLGPIFGPHQFATIVHTDNLANHSFSLGGFQQFTLASFQLNPEVPPTAIAQPEGSDPYVVNEGSTIQLDGSTSFDLDGDALTYKWDLDGNGTFETPGAIVNFTLGYDGPAIHMVSLQVCDDLNCDVDSTSVAVLNVAPSIDAGSNQSVPEGTFVTLASTYSDPGFPDTHTATVNWGDGTPTQPGTVTPVVGSPGVPTTGTVSASHAYGDNGTYTVTV
ncbi:MAG: hypothetical protein FJ317_01995, partial [SAR202 cluster bacterium]|nr:hypothetical protein [SAR202 cluster bacterium]